MREVMLWERPCFGIGYGILYAVGKAMIWDIKVYGDECNGMDVGDQLDFLVHSPAQLHRVPVPPSATVELAISITRGLSLS